MLQARLFNDFKRSTVLLIWGDNADMAALLDHLSGLKADQPVTRIGRGENTVTVGLSAQPGRSLVKSAPTYWECSEDILRRTADLIEPLLRSTGHQFVDADGDADEVVISANEYPAEFGR